MEINFDQITDQSKFINFSIFKNQFIFCLFKMNFFSSNYKEKNIILI